MCPPGADCDSFIVGVAPEASAPGLFSGPYEHRTISGGIGHNLPQEAPAPFVDAIVAVDTYGERGTRWQRSPPGSQPRGAFPSLAGATEWLHSPPLDPAGLRRKVVLIDFCTYTCINWLRTLSYVRAWARSYRDQGLVVVGVHTPEFSFKHDLENVRRPLASMAIDYPIAVDNDYAIWDAFANHYWPVLYFIDADGTFRHHWFGEGDYERSEAVIQQLLRDAGADDVGDEVVAIDPVGPEVEADWDNLGSPETYVGTERTRNFAARDRLSRGEAAHTYEAPDNLRVNDWALTGYWTAEAESVFSNEPNGRITFQVPRATSTS